MSRDAMGDLVYLSNKPFPDADLSACQALLDLFPGCLEDSSELERRALLREAIKRVLGKAYVDLQSDNGDQLTAKRVMACGALFGLVTLCPTPGYSGPYVSDQIRPSQRKASRQELAAAWVGLGGARQFRNAQQACLKAFASVLKSLLPDEGFVQSLREKLGLRPHVRSVGEVHSRDQVSILMQAQLSAIASSSPWPFGDLAQSDSIYIEPSLTGSSQGSRGGNLNVNSIYQALAQDSHVVITGGPGHGKTTLALRTVARLSDQELNRSLANVGESRVPLFVPAVYLAGEGSFARLVAAAINSHLTGFAIETVDENLFSTTPPGRQGWVLFVDGLDEVADPVERHRIAAILAHHFDAPHLRFVLLSRSDEPQLTASAKCVCYELMPLSRREVRQLAVGWLRGADDSGLSWTGFWMQAVHSRIDGLLNIPLLATIALIAYMRDGDHRLPTSRLGLYEKFVAHLLNGRQAKSKVRRQLLVAAEPFGAAATSAVDWIFDHRLDICAHAALALLSRDRRGVIGGAIERIRTALGSEFFIIPDWKARLEAILLDTGLLVSEAGSLRFLHHTIAEYLAAPLLGLPRDLREHPLIVGQSTYVDDPQADRSWDLLEWRILAWVNTNRDQELSDWLVDNCDTNRLADLVADGLPLSSSAEEKLRTDVVCATSGPPYDINDPRLLPGQRYQAGLWSCMADFTVFWVSRLASRIPSLYEHLVSMLDMPIDDLGLSWALAELLCSPYVSIARERAKRLADAADARSRAIAALAYAVAGEDELTVAVSRSITRPPAVWPSYNFEDDVETARVIVRALTICDRMGESVEALDRLLDSLPYGATASQLKVGELYLEVGELVKAVSVARHACVASTRIVCTAEDVVFVPDQQIVRHALVLMRTCGSLDEAVRIIDRLTMEKYDSPAWSYSGAAEIYGALGLTERLCDVALAGASRGLTLPSPPGDALSCVRLVKLHGCGRTAVERLARLLYGSRLSWTASAEAVRCLEALNGAALGLRLLRLRLLAQPFDGSKIGALGVLLSESSHYSELGAEFRQLAAELRAVLLRSGSLAGAEREVVWRLDPRYSNDWSSKDRRLSRF